MPSSGKVSSRAARAVGFKYSSFKQLLSYRKRVSREHSMSSAVKNFSQLKNFELSICSAGLSSMSLMCLLLNIPDFNTSHSNDSGRNSLMFFRRNRAAASAISGPKAAPSAITEEFVARICVLDDDKLGPLASKISITVNTICRGVDTRVNGILRCGSVGVLKTVDFINAIGQLTQ